jgi:glutamine synthetase
MTPQEVLALCREKDVKAVDLRFMDFPGLWQHFTIPVSKLDEDVFEDGLGFDGSSIRGWQAINESDMLVVPQPETAFHRPVHDAPTLVDDLQHPGPDHAGGLQSRPAQRGPQVGQLPQEHGHRRHRVFRSREAEFFIFDDIRFDQNPHEGYYHIDSIEGRVESGRG